MEFKPDDKRGQATGRSRECPRKLGTANSPVRRGLASKRWRTNAWPLRSPSARSRSPLLRSPNQRRIWRQLVRVVIACLSISPVRRRGRGLRSAHWELRRAYRAFITCWQTETGLLLPTGMLPAPYGLALPQSAHFVAVAISADIAVVSSR